MSDESQYADRGVDTIPYHTQSGRDHRETSAPQFRAHGGRRRGAGRRRSPRGPHRKNRVKRQSRPSSRMQGLVQYDDDEDDDENDDLDGPQPVLVQPAMQLPLLAAQAAGSSDDNDEGDSDGGDGSDEVKRPLGESAWKARRIDSLPKPSSGDGKPSTDQSLPSIEDVLDKVEVPDFLAVPRTEIEHEAFDARAPAPAAHATAGAAATLDELLAVKEPAPGAVTTGKAGKTAAKAGVSAERSRKDERDKVSTKDKTKEKRKRDQSASFLGGRWKTDQEMHMRDYFDS
eukprot:6204438-Pleurochrysis_carterae.AAC.2